MEPISFAGQVVVVTGAGGGLGRAYAMEIARRGGQVVVNDLGGSVAGEGGSKGYADAVVAEIHNEGGQAIANYDSVATAAGGRRIIEAALDTWGRIDAVINNAGNMRFGPFEDLTADDLASLIAVHAAGTWNVTHAAWPHMKRQGYGRVVFTTSSAGMLGSAMLSAYGAAKGAVMGLMHGLAEEGAPHGILCNAVMPNAASRMTAEVGEGTLGENPWAVNFFQTFNPTFTAGLTAFLASKACTTHHGTYSSLGGRIARVFVAVTGGLRGDSAVPLTVEEIAGKWDLIRDDSRGYAIPAHVADEFRIVAETG